MRFSLVTLLSLLVASAVAAPAAPYEGWSEDKMKVWLEDHDVPYAENISGEKLQNLVADSYNSVYDTWSDSELRGFFVRHGLFVPSSQPTESRLAQIPDSVKEKAEQGGEQAAAAADAVEQQRQRMIRAARRTYDDSWSTWDDSDVKEWLEDHGFLTPPETSHTWYEHYAQLYFQPVQDYLVSARDSTSDWASTMYGKIPGDEITEKLLSGYSDEQMGSWLYRRGVDDAPSDREELKERMRRWLKENRERLDGYKNAMVDYVWQTWTTTQQRAWLVREGILDQTAAADKKRVELEQLIADNWYGSWNNLEHGWKDSDMRQWLIDNGYMKSDYEAKRDEILDMFKKNYQATSKKSSEYTAWSDSRIRTWLRDHNVDVPMRTPREELLQKMKETYVSTTGGIAGAFEGVKEAIGGAVKNVQDMLTQNKVDRDVAAAEKQASKAAESAVSSASSAAEQAKKSADKVKQEL